MSDAITAVYQIWGDQAEAAGRAAALAVEQSHEFPAELAPPHTAVSRGVVRELRPVPGGPVLATIDYPADLAGGELPQLLVLLFGNCSLLPGIRLVDLDLPQTLAASLGGPRVGLDGLRHLLGAWDRPLLATALKPVGLAAGELADLAYDLAVGGLDLIKEDQGLADQPWAPFDERVQRCAEAVATANAETGGRAIYLPALNGPVGEVDRRIALALDAGAGGFLLVPGVGGLDLIRHVAASVPPGVPLLAHPAFLGSFVTSPTAGIAHDVLFGLLLRLAGADAAVFPSFGGRFSFTPEQCRAIADGCLRPFAGLAASVPTPGGGMSVQRVPELVDFYGPDVMLLIGGELHRDGDRRAGAAAFRRAVQPTG